MKGVQLLRRITVFLSALLPLMSGMAEAVVVLQYHHIDNDAPKYISTSPKLFGEHLGWLKENGYEVAPLPAIARLIRAGQPLPNNTAVITFDKTSLSIHKNAFPLLKEYGFPFTIFVDTKAVDKVQHQRQTLNWDQLREMAEAGATLANYTAKDGHLIERLQGETQVDWLKRIASDIQTAEQRIQEETEQNHKLLAWPFGETTTELEQLILDAGYLGFGQQPGAIDQLSDKTLLPRFLMAAGYGSMKTFPLKIQSLPLQVTSMTPDSSLVPKDGNMGKLRISLKPGEWAADQVICYAQGSILKLEWLDKEKTVFETELPQPLPLGHSDINCTVPAPNGSWFSFSRDFVRLTRDGLSLD